MLRLSLVLWLFTAFGSSAFGQALDVPMAISAATKQSPAYAAVSIAHALKLPSRNFDAVPWAALPKSAVPELHAIVRFYDALLADLEEGALNEKIAIAFIRFERARDHGKEITARVRTLEARYRDLVMERDAARVAQREARSLLAIAMGQPGRLQSELIEPRSGIGGALGEFSPRVPKSFDEGAVFRTHAAFTIRQHAEHAAGSATVAARKRLEAAEALQDEQRVKYSAGASGLDLGDAMADVAAAEVALKRAQFRADVYLRSAAALAAPP